MRKRNLIVSFLITLGALYSCKNTSNQHGDAVTSFPVQSVSKSEITIYKEYATNIEGVQNIEIRPKVDGFVEKIYIDEGATVKKGDLLFKLSAETLNQQVNAANANIEVAKAQVVSAQVEVDKITPLVNKNIISPVQLKSAESNLNAAKAQLNAAKADYLNAKENLGYTLITSPVDGMVGSLPYRVGSLVGRTESQPLTTVSKINNVYAYFTMNEKQLLQFNRQLNGNSVKDKIKELPEIELILADGSLYEHKGKIETINGMVNPRTGSVSYRAIFPNPSNLLRNGLSGTIKFPTTINNAILIPQQSTFELQGKKFVYLVDKENTVKSKEIHISKSVDNNFIVLDGINVGQQYVYNGILKLREGMKIVPKYNSSAHSTSANQALSTK